MSPQQPRRALCLSKNPRTRPLPLEPGSDHLFIQANGADAVPSCPEMQPGKIPLTPQELPMHPNRRLAFEPSHGIGHTVLGGNTETQVHMSRHRVTLDEFDALLLAEFTDDPSSTAAELPIDDTASVLWPKNHVILTIPADVRLALPVSHENLLSSERGGSLKGGSLAIPIFEFGVCSCGYLISPL